jgi:UTP--glucose-1-phosphate uridylyltransferase
MHVLTPVVMEILGRLFGAGEDKRLTLSAALAELTRKEQYLALETMGRRYNVGVKYGLLMAQLALALNGRDREEVLSRMLEVLAAREGAAVAE